MEQGVNWYLSWTPNCCPTAIVCLFQGALESPQRPEINRCLELRGVVVSSAPVKKIHGIGRYPTPKKMTSISGLQTICFFVVGGYVKMTFLFEGHFLLLCFWYVTDSLTQSTSLPRNCWSSHPGRLGMWTTATNREDTLHERGAFKNSFWNNRLVPLKRMTIDNNLF